MAIHGPCRKCRGELRSFKAHFEVNQKLLFIPSQAALIPKPQGCGPPLTHRGTDHREKICSITDDEAPGMQKRSMMKCINKNITIFCSSSWQSCWSHSLPAPLASGQSRRPASLHRHPAYRTGSLHV